MKQKSTNGLVAGVVLGLLMVGALSVLLLGSNSTEIEIFTSVTLGNPQDVGPSAAVVYGKHQSGGTSILGLRIGHTSYRVSVQFYAAPGCYELASSDSIWPTPFEECNSPVPIAGEMSGGGTAFTGESIISVDVEVSKDCYQAVVQGDPWPPSTATCRA